MADSGDKGNVIISASRNIPSSLSIVLVFVHLDSCSPIGDSICNRVYLHTHIAHRYKEEHCLYRNNYILYYNYLY